MTCSTRCNGSVTAARRSSFAGARAHTQSDGRVRTRALVRANARADGTCMYRVCCMYSCACHSSGLFTSQRTTATRSSRGDVDVDGDDRCECSVRSTLETCIRTDTGYSKTSGGKKSTANVVCIAYERIAPEEFGQRENKSFARIQQTPLT